MKKISLIVICIYMLIIIACTSDNCQNPEPVEKRPFPRYRYQPTVIIDSCLVKGDIDMDIEGNWIKESELKKAEKALNELSPFVRGFYVAQYSLNKEDYGEFQGLSCKVCNKWKKYGHDEDCPVKNVESDSIAIMYSGTDIKK